MLKLFFFSIFPSYFKSFKNILLYFEMLWYLFIIFFFTQMICLNDLSQSSFQNKVSEPLSFLNHCLLIVYLRILYPGDCRMVWQLNHMIQDTGFFHCSNSSFFMCLFSSSCLSPLGLIIAAIDLGVTYYIYIHLIASKIEEKGKKA